MAVRSCITSQNRFVDLLCYAIAELILYQMPAIMSLLVFQSSRLQLLASLKHRFSVAAAHRDEHVKRGEPEDEHERKSIDNLLQAVEAADQQCKRLEFWSDFRSVAQDGGVLGAADHSHRLDHEWKDAAHDVSDSDESSPSHIGTKSKGKVQTREDIVTQDLKPPDSLADRAKEKEMGGTASDEHSDEESTPGSILRDGKEAHGNEAAIPPTKGETSGKKEEIKNDTPNTSEERTDEEENDDVD
jgi:hypothetical protein